MVSIRPALAAAGAAALLALCPPAHASPVTGRGACDEALAVAGQAEHDYQALKRELQRIVADGGHPDASQRRALGDAEAKTVSTASQAQRICGP
ncbi:hypothetical protein JK361_11810 [Streptomyces sp. 5-8]|uniref:Secreted protein n=1 Tax=Streptomyces musisoli TaxID=2802280 RepID=A0ABS1NZQ8_9ACTN|nr:MULTISPECIES: hypothetical protein [Streptomyces]MBL1105265.1 hypothetical protein [Streptomyces musisoli]MBY8843806.1 hypothetical protein [Streptomyces sp. SP2-10]